MIVTAIREVSDMSSMFRSDPLLIEVGVGEFSVAEHPQRLMTPALGSCVGVAIWDPLLHRGALAHIMLPRPAEGATMADQGRFAASVVPELVRLMVDSGSLKRRLCAKIAGGAAMFRSDSGLASIGERNVAEVKRQLSLMSVPVVAEDIGAAHARTVELLLDSGVLLVRSYRYGVRRL